jgi:hypothetical protein
MTNTKKCSKILKRNLIIHLPNFKIINLKSFFNNINNKNKTIYSSSNTKEKNFSKINKLRKNSFGEEKNNKLIKIFIFLLLFSVCNNIEKNFFSFSYSFSFSKIYFPIYIINSKINFYHFNQYNFTNLFL